MSIRVIAASRARLFAIALEKSIITGDPYERGFEEIVNRFDIMFARMRSNSGNQQTGLIVVAESAYRENLELLAHRIRTQGHRWGQTRNLADIPYFAPAKNTRLLQLADFVSNATYGRYENGYVREFDQLMPRFDQEENQLHGLVHIGANRYNCYCPACILRRS